MPAAAAYPVYSNIHQSLVSHHSRQSPRHFGRGYDVCDSPDGNSHVAGVR